MKKLLALITMIAFFSGIAIAQTGPNVPQDYSLKKAEDYGKYQTNVVDCIKWMRSSHPDFKAKDRKEAAAFVLQWITGSPDVSVQLGTKYFTEVNDDKKFIYGADLGIMFMFGKTLYIMEHPDDKDEANAEYAGVKDMITLYGVITAKNSDMKSKTIEKYIKSEKDGKLLDEVKKECAKAYKK